MTHDQYLDTPSHLIAWDLEMASIHAKYVRERAKDTR